MARQRHVGQLEQLSLELARPLVGADGPDLGSAMQAMITWSTSTTWRERLMGDSGFPLPGDLQAFLLVNQLVYRGACRPTDMADAIQTGPANVSKIVKRLEAAGLVTRRPDPVDDRAVVIGLTELGRRVGAGIVAAVEAQLDPALAGFTADELADFERLVVKFARGLDALPGHPLTRVAGVSFVADVPAGS